MRFLASYLFLFILILCGCSNDTEVFSKCWVEEEGVFVKKEIDTEAVYLGGGEDGFIRGLYKTLKYPNFAKENDIKGTVEVQFEISIQGSIQNIVIVEDIGGGCGDAVVLAIENLGSGALFSPAMDNGNKVRTRKEFPVMFRLE